MVRLQLIVAFVCDGGVPGFNVERAVRFEIAAMHFVDVFEALPMDDFDEFFAGEGLALQCFGINLAIPDEYDGTALERPGEARGTEEQADDQVVDGEQAEGADDAAGDGVVFADDGVLHGIGEREQNDKVEGIQLRKFAFAEEAQEQNEHKVHDDRTQELLEERKVKMEHVVCYRCEDHGARIACGLWLCHSHSDVASL